MHNPFAIDGRAPWFALQIWAGREQRTAQHLRMRGYEIFLPTYRERRQWSDRVKTTERALFAGYLFCRFTTETVGALLTAPGVIELVGDGRRPLPVPDEELLAIQRIVDARLDAAPCAYFQGGERVRIEHGPLEGTEGTVVRHQNHHRVIVSIALLQRSVAVELDPAWISAAPVPWTRAASR